MNRDQRLVDLGYEISACGKTCAVSWDDIRAVVTRDLLAENSVEVTGKLCYGKNSAEIPLVKIGLTKGESLCLKMKMSDFDDGETVTSIKITTHDDDLLGRLVSEKSCKFSKKLSGKSLEIIYGGNVSAEKMRMISEDFYQLAGACCQVAFISVGLFW